MTSDDHPNTRARQRSDRVAGLHRRLFVIGVLTAVILGFLCGLVWVAWQLFAPSRSALSEVAPWT